MTIMTIMMIVSVAGPVMADVRLAASLAFNIVQIAVEMCLLVIGIVLGGSAHRMGKQE